MLSTASKAVNEGKTTGTGIFGRFLPAMNEYSAKIKSLERQLGLGVVGSVTFGALSKGELDLALGINFSPTLKGDALINDIKDRLNAKRKLLEGMSDAYERLRGADTLKEFRDGEIKTAKQREKVLNAWDEYGEELKKANPEQFGSMTKSDWRYELSSDQREAILQRLLER